MNKFSASILILIFIVTAFWLGEAGKGLFQFLPYAIGLIGIFVTIFLISKKWNYRIAYAFLFVILYAASFYAGDCSFYQTFNTCIEEAESIRVELADYKAQNGKFPNTLEELNRPLPCSRCLRGSILEYKSTASSYKISFKDWLVEHSATDKEPFMAHK